MLVVQLTNQGEQVLPSIELQMLKTYHLIATAPVTVTAPVTATVTATAPVTATATATDFYAFFYNAYGDENHHGFVLRSWLNQQAFV